MGTCVMDLQTKRQLSLFMALIIPHLQATMAFVGTQSLLRPPFATTVSSAGSGSFIAAYGRSTAFQPFSRSTGTIPSSRYFNRFRSTWAPAWMGKSGTIGRGNVGWRRGSSKTIAVSRDTTGTSATALRLGVGDGNDLSPGDKDGWRQRMVRTIVTAYLRIRAILAVLVARLGLGRTAQVRALNTTFLCKHEIHFQSYEQVYVLTSSKLGDTPVTGKTRRTLTALEVRQYC